MELIERIDRAAKQSGLDKAVIELAERIIHDAHPALNSAYLFSETADNQESVFGGAETLKKKGLSETFYIIGTDAKNGFPGYGAWKGVLEQRIDSESIIPVPIVLDKDQSLNTHSESVALLEYLRTTPQGLYVVAPPFHQLRAFMTAASVAIKKGSPIVLFNHLGKELPYDEEVRHSQGILVAKRSDFFQSETDRISAYQRKGDILPASEILRYMDSRKF